MKKNKKKLLIKIIVIIIIVITLTIINIDCANINNTSVGNLFVSDVIAIAVIGVFVYKLKIDDDKEKLVYEPFLLDIHRKDDNDIHIRITNDNLMFKYVKIYPIISKLEKYTSARAYSYTKFYGTNVVHDPMYRLPKYNIMDKSKLNQDEVNRILKSVEELENDDIDGEIIIVAKGVGRKCVRADELNSIIGSLSMMI